MLGLVLLNVCRHSDNWLQYSNASEALLLPYTFTNQTDLMYSITSDIATLLTRLTDCLVYRVNARRGMANPVYTFENAETDGYEQSVGYSSL